MDLDAAVELLVRVTGDAAYRERARSGDAWRRAILRAAARLEGEAPVPPLAPGAKDAAATPSARVAPMVARIRERNACPHFVRRSDCGCGVNGCRAGKGRAGKVVLDDCLACLAESRADGDPTISPIRMDTPNAEGEP